MVVRKGCLRLTRKVEGLQAHLIGLKKHIRERNKRKSKVLLRTKQSHEKRVTLIQNSFISGKMMGGE